MVDDAAFADEPGEPAPLTPTATASVIVPARDAAATLPTTLAALVAQDHPGRLEILVACPPDDLATRAVLARYADDPRVRTVDNPAGTTPAALNAGLAVAAGRVIVRVDAHAVPGPAHVRRCVELLAATGAGNVGGGQTPVAEGGFAAAVADALASPAGSGGATYRRGDQPGPADTVYLGAFRREALAAVGGFDEALARNQDYELNWRLRAAGWLVYFHPDLGVGYRPRGSPAALARQYADYGRYKRAMLARHPRSVRLRQLAAPALVLALAASAVAAVALGSWWPLALPGGYAAALAAAAVAADTRRRAPAVAVALAVMHLAWGTGFLVLPTRRG
jgi:glycosyltransferase involved in cell wall biosynthesis